MASDRTSPDRLWHGLLLIALPALLLVGLEVYNATAVVPQLGRSQALVAHTLEVIVAARALDQAVADAESSARGYLITTDNAYLDAYRAAVRVAPGRLAHLRHLTLDNSDQQRRIALIESAVDGKLGELQNAIDARRGEGFTAARNTVESSRALGTRQIISGLVDLTIAAERRLLDQRNASLVGAESRAATTSTIGVSLTIVLMLFGTYLLVRALFRDAQSLASLKESEERFRLLVSGVKDYAIFLLDTNGHVASWNLGAARIKGYSPSEILGQHFSIFYAEEDRQNGVPQCDLAEAAAEGSMETEGWRVRRDGSRFYANAVITPLFDDNGNLRGFAKITRDVTERRAQQKAVDESRAALAQAQKMEALGHLTGGMAHDFNNLLTVIIGSIDLAERKPAEEKTAKLLGAAKQAASQGATMVRRLLAFSRRQTLEPQTVDVNRLVGGISELLRRTLGDEIALETVLGAGLWRSLVDPGQLENALVNLAVNARDAMPESGKLTIETGNTYLDEDYAHAHGEVAPGQYVQIAVSDSGCGMSVDIISRAFEPFFTTKTEGKGTGLGLSQVHGFIKQSGGHIALYSEPGHGTTVKMYLPRHVGPETLERREPEKREVVAASEQTILFVEDDALVRLYGTEALKGLGYRVLEAADGADALRVLEEHGEVELLFTDVGLPGGMNGRKLAEEARARKPGLKVLFATGYARNAIVHHGVLDAGVELLEKPYTTESLFRKIQQILAKDSVGQHPP